MTYTQVLTTIQKKFLKRRVMALQKGYMGQQDDVYDFQKGYMG